MSVVEEDVGTLLTPALEDDINTGPYLRISKGNKIIHPYAMDVLAHFSSELVSPLTLTLWRLSLTTLTTLTSTCNVASSSSRPHTTFELSARSWDGKENCRKSV